MFAGYLGAGAFAGSSAPSRASVALTRFCCGLRGHLQQLRGERDRLSLVCTWCGHQTDGWTLRTTTLTFTRSAERTAA